MVFSYRHFRSHSSIRSAVISLVQIIVEIGDDPFLSFRSPSLLTCLLYKDIQSALKSYAKFFNLDATWFNTQSIRMLAPTIARAAKAETSTILHMGRWKTVPSAMKYQEQSTAVNNSIVAMVSNPTLYTAEDILFSRLLASRALDRKPTVRLPWMQHLGIPCVGERWGSMYHQCRLGVGLRYCETYHVLSRTVCRDGSQTTSGQLPYPRVGNLNGHRLSTHVLSLCGS
jgi:hypothetical protein